MPKVLSKKINSYKNLIKGSIQLSNYTNVKFRITKDGFWQWGGSKDDLWITFPIVENLWNEFTYQ